MDVCKGALSWEQWVNADNHWSPFFLCFSLSSSYQGWQGCCHCLKGGHLEDGEEGSIKWICREGGGGERGVPLVRGAGGVHVSLTHLDCTTSLSIQQGEKQRELAHSVMPDCGHHEVSCSALVHILKTVYLTKEFLECNCWEYELKERSVPCCLVYSKWLLHSRINPLLVGPDIHHSRKYIPFLLVLVYLFIHSFTASTLSWLLWFQLLPCPACETYPAYPGNIGHKKKE